MPAIDLSKPSESQVRWSLFSGIAVWFVHLVLLEGLVSVSCKWGGLTFPVGALSGLQIVEAVINLISVLAMLVLIYLPWRQWRTFQSETPPRNEDLLQDTEKYRRPLMAFIAMMLNIFLTIYMIATFVPVFALKTCGQA
jgi:threonine/homoserine/homoserine lactone efflux protein